MTKNVLREHLERNTVVYFLATLFSCLFILIANRLYYNKIYDVEIFTYIDMKKIRVDDNKISFIYLIEDLEEAKKRIHTLGGVFQLAASLNSNVYFLAKKSEASKLQSFFELHDINEDIYLTNRLVFWEYSKGKKPTLLVFKHNRLIYYDCGCLDWNQAKKLDGLREIINER